jgi:glutathione S-transferase
LSRQNEKIKSLCFALEINGKFMAQLVPLVVLLTVLLMFWTMLMVGRARGRYGIKAPATSGHPAFDLAFRVQMNTLEHAVLFLPTLWLCANYFRADVAGIAGLVWLLGRVLYALGYYRDASKRAIGFFISMGAMLVLIACGGFGMLKQLVA